MTFEGYSTISWRRKRLGGGDQSVKLLTRGFGEGPSKVSTVSKFATKFLYQTCWIIYTCIFQLRGEGVLEVTKKIHVCSFREGGGAVKIAKTIVRLQLNDPLTIWIVTTRCKWLIHLCSTSRTEWLISKLLCSCLIDKNGRA